MDVGVYHEGMPFKEYAAGGPPQILPHAEFAIVGSLSGSVSVELRRLSLDGHLLRNATLSVDYPMSAPLAGMYA
jgi:hypothetical protein